MPKSKSHLRYFAFVAILLGACKPTDATKTSVSDDYKAKLNQIAMTITLTPPPGTYTGKQTIHFTRSATSSRSGVIEWYDAAGATAGNPGWGFGCADGSAETCAEVSSSMDLHYRVHDGLTYSDEKVAKYTIN